MKTSKDSNSAKDAKDAKSAFMNDAGKDASVSKDVLNVLKHTKVDEKTDTPQDNKVENVKVENVKVDAIPFETTMREMFLLSAIQELTERKTQSVHIPIVLERMIKNGFSFPAFDASDSPTKYWILCGKEKDHAQVLYKFCTKELRATSDKILSDGNMLYYNNTYILSEKPLEGVKDVNGFKSELKRRHNGEGK